ncbi:hypothetical protein [Cupriavidus necator]
MTPKQYLLSKLAEKCSQVSLSCHKAMQYGLDAKHRADAYTSYQDDISNRMNDVRAVLLLLKEAGVEIPFDKAEIGKAKERIAGSLLSSVDRGTVVINKNNLYG